MGPAYVAVVGAGSADSRIASAAEEVGRLLASRGAVVVCGGLGGVMEAACRGAKSAGGTTVGILPGFDRDEANAWVDVAIPTGLGEARNALVVRAADVLIAVGGEYGTLSEIALALKTGKPVVGLETWELSRRGVPATDIVLASTPAEAVERALELVTTRR
ncbi:MAG TPA: TIGR00725 family protein [Myxococcaceae bacterium]